MHSRSEIIWAPFNSVINSSEVIQEFKNEQNKITKPLLTEEKINEIERYIITSYNQNEKIHLKYYSNYQIKKISGFITKIDKTTKRIWINHNTFLYFTNIIDFF